MRDRGELERRSDEQAVAAKERPLWRIVLVLYGSIVVLVAAVMILAFGVASLVTGSAY